MNVLDLFSGIGGFSLGLERAGMRTVAFCEIDPFCRAVLRKHWPAVPVFGDIAELRGAEVISITNAIRCERWAHDQGQTSAKRNGHPQAGIDLICGGFPCQDISVAGKGEGIEGSRSGLWLEYARIIGEVRPRYVIVENVSALLGRGLERVLGDLAALGFDAEWHCIPASAIGAPHRRDRVWIVANANGSGQRERRRPEPVQAEVAGTEHAGQVSNPMGDGRGSRRAGRPSGISARLQNTKSALVDTDGAGSSHPSQGNTWGKEFSRWQPDYSATGGAGWWLVEPDVGRVANGVPARVDRLRALGNAIVPQIAEIIGKAIMEVEDA